MERWVFAFVPATAGMLAAPHVDKRLRGLGAFPVSSTPEAAANRTKAEIARWNRVIDTAGIARQ